MRIEENNSKQIESLSRLKPYERLKAAFELHDFARARILAQLKHNNPDMTEGELTDKLNERFRRYGPR